MRRGFLRFILALFGLEETSDVAKVLVYTLSILIIFASIYFVVNYLALLLGLISIPSVNSLILLPPDFLAELTKAKILVTNYNPSIKLLGNTIPIALLDSLMLFFLLIFYGMIYPFVKEFVGPGTVFGLIILTSLIYIPLIYFFNANYYIPILMILLSMLYFSIFFYLLTSGGKTVSKEGKENEGESRISIFTKVILSSFLVLIVILGSMYFFNILNLIISNPLIPFPNIKLYYFNTISLETYKYTVFPALLFLVLITPLIVLFRYLILPSFSEGSFFSFGNVAILLLSPFVLWLAGKLFLGNWLYLILLLIGIFFAIAFFSLEYAIEFVWFTVVPIILMLVSVPFGWLLNLIVLIVNSLVTYVLFFSVIITPLFLIPTLIIKAMHLSVYAEESIKDILPSYNTAILNGIIEYIFSIILSVLLVVLSSYAAVFVLQAKDYSSFFVLYLLTIFGIAYVYDVFSILLKLTTANLGKKSDIKNVTEISDFSRFINISFPIFIVFILSFLMVPALNTIGNNILAFLGINVKIPKLIEENKLDLQTIFAEIMSNPYEYNLKFISALKETNLVIPKRTGNIEEYTKYTYSIQFERFEITPTSNTIYCTNSGCNTYEFSNYLFVSLIYDAPTGSYKYFQMAICRPTCKLYGIIPLNIEKFEVVGKGVVNIKNIMALEYSQNSYYEKPILLKDCYLLFNGTEGTFLEGQKIFSRNIIVNLNFSKDQINSLIINKNLSGVAKVECKFPVVLYVNAMQPSSSYVIYVSTSSTLKYLFGDLYQDVLEIIAKGISISTRASYSPIVIRMASLYKSGSKSLPYFELPEALKLYCKDPNTYGNLLSVLKTISITLLLDLSTIPPEKLGLIKGVKVKGVGYLLDVTDPNNRFITITAKGPLLGRCSLVNDNNVELDPNDNRLVHIKTDFYVNRYIMVNLNKKSSPNSYIIPIVSGENKLLSEIVRKSPFVCLIKPFKDEDTIKKYCNIIDKMQIIPNEYVATMNANVLLSLYTTLSTSYLIKVYK